MAAILRAGCGNAARPDLWGGWREVKQFTKRHLYPTIIIKNIENFDYFSLKV